METISYPSSSDLRDPEDRRINEQDSFEVREKMLDKTLADSFPASDPPSTNPAPATDSFVRSTLD
jgi:hypothetical protein